MALNIWRGNSPSTQQVCTATPANVEVGDVFTLIITDDNGNTGSVEFTATAATVANVTAGLTAAWNASTHPLITPITAVDGATLVTLTADSAGIPFALTSTAVNGGAADTQTLAIATTTANSGPYDAGLASNWSLNAVPVNTNDVTFPAGAPSCLYRLNLSAVTAAAIKVEEGYTGSIGRVANGWMYTLRLACTSISIRGSGSLVAFDIGASAVPVYVDHEGSAGTTGRNCVNVLGSAITNVYVEQGDVGIATYPGQTATITGTFGINSGTLAIGTGVTVAGTTLYCRGSTVHSWVSVPTIHVLQAAHFYQDAGNYTTATIYGFTPDYPSTGGTLHPINSGTYATTTTYHGATIDNRDNLQTKTFTTTTHYGDCVVYDPASRITWTNVPSKPGGYYLGNQG